MDTPHPGTDAKIEELARRFEMLFQNSDIHIDYFNDATREPNRCIREHREPSHEDAEHYKQTKQVTLLQWTLIWLYEAARDMDIPRLNIDPTYILKQKLDGLSIHLKP